MSDVLLATVPILEQSGANWVIFQLDFQMVVEGKGLWGHYNRSKVQPTTSSLPTMTVFSPTLATSATSIVSSLTATLSTSSTAPTVLFGTVTEVLEWD